MSNHSTTLFADSATPVVHLSQKLRELYDKIVFLSRETGWCYAGAAWLSHTFGVTEGQITRRIKALVAFGLLERRHTPGERRLLRPTPAPFFAPPESLPRRQNADSLSIREKSLESSNTQAASVPLSDVAEPAIAVVLDTPVELTPATAKELIAVGMEKAVALRLAKEYAATCKAWLGCLTELRQAGKRNLPGYLRHVITSGFLPPKQADAPLLCPQHALYVPLSPPTQPAEVIEREMRQAIKLARYNLKGK